MGGLAAVIDWDRPVAPDALDPMLALTPHRATGGTRRIALDHAVLAESFFAQDAPNHPDVATLGHLSIVGDLRLWNRNGLRARAGGGSAAAGMDDRRLLLAAYQRTGIDFLDDVDGDFSFVIWDDRERRAIAVRDRFGVKPLFFERTSVGIRFASEPKQLVATSTRVIEPCIRSLVEYVTDRYEETRFTFFEGVERVRPSTALVAALSDERVVRYWNPVPTTTKSAAPADVLGRFREQLVDSVRRHTDGANATVSHLTGGLDSTSIAAAAHILTQRNQLRSALQTVSAVFPGYENDESEAIGEVAARQPFPHHDFVPQPETIAQFEADMWISDTPRPTLVDGLWSGTIEAAHATGADLVLSGLGGDEVLDQYPLAADLLRRGYLRHWTREVRARSAWSERHPIVVAADSVRQAIPSVVKRPVRKALGAIPSTPATLIAPGALRTLKTVAVEANPAISAYPSSTQNLMLWYTRSPRFGCLLEYYEVRYARSGLTVSYPYLDRRLVEHVASISISERPSSGGSKALIREGFTEWLPRSVLRRRFKTVADDYLGAVISRQSPYYRAQYPAISESAHAFIDADRYRQMMLESEADHLSFLFGESLWKAWTIMAWLDGFDRYGWR